MNIKRLIGPLTWAYAIIVGGALLITPEGIVPIVFQLAGIVGIVLGGANFMLNKEQLSGGHTLTH